jgi:hypothetical protein
LPTDRQIGAYLETFHIPEDYQQRIMEMHRKLLDNYDIEKEQRQLTARLDRVKDLYKWGDITVEEYQRDKDQIQRELAKLTPFQDSSDTLQRLAELLGSVANAWERATQEQRNMLARCVFQEIWIKDKDVVAVKPQPEFKPFFAMNWEEYSKIMKIRPRGDSGSNVQHTAYLLEILYPAISQPVTTYKLPCRLWKELAKRHSTQSLRQLAKEYGVSHEAVRRALAAAATGRNDICQERPVYV